MSVRFACNFLCLWPNVKNTGLSEKYNIFSHLFSSKQVQTVWLCTSCSIFVSDFYFWFKGGSRYVFRIEFRGSLNVLFFLKTLWARSYTLGSQVYTLFSLISHGHGCAHTASTSLSSGNFSLCLEVTYCEKISQSVINRTVCFKGDNKMCFLLQWSNVYK